MKIAVITDLHYSKVPNLACPGRAGEKAVELLTRSVELLNTSIKPDLLLLGGDLVNNPKDYELLLELAEILKKADCPQIVIPGNHDPNPGVFYTIFQRPPEFLDIAGIRFLAFPDDLQTSGYNAYRQQTNLRRIKNLSKGPPTVLFQHVPLYERETIKCYYNYDNAEEIFSACQNVVLSISGHEHAGFQPSFSSRFPVVIVPALCEGHHPFAVLELSAVGKLNSYELHYMKENRNI